MGQLRTLAFAASAVALMGSSALAAPAPVYNWSGLYVGVGGGGYSSGVMTLEGNIGAKFDGFGGWGGGNIYYGVEGSAGIQLPTNRFELWAYGKAGPEIGQGTWLYGVGGIGVIDMTPVWGIGAGIEKNITDRLSLYGEFLGRGSFASTPSELGFRFGAHYALQPTDYNGGGKPFLSGLNGPDLSGLFGSTSHSLYIGGSLGFLPDPGVFISSVEFGVNCMHAADLELGLRGRIGLQLDYNYLEAWGGVAVGKNINDHFKLYGFGELGTINSSLVQSLGVGVEYKLGSNVGLYGEGFEFGALGGSSIEIGSRIGARWYFDAPPP
ncbi:MAG: hypothetical protein ABI697_07545 [Devosia sp.]